MPVENTIRLRIARCDPETDATPSYEEFDVPATPHMRVLDALEYVYTSLGHTFAFRWYCGTKRCGMCGVTVNGEPKLACWEPAEAEMTVEPLRHFPLIRDLVVDFSGNEERVTALHPVLVRSEPYPGFPEPTTHDEMRPHYDLMGCIDCRICDAACSVVAQVAQVAQDGADGFAGPYALVQLAKIATHPRNGADLSDAIAAARPELCIGCGECVRLCPNDIPIITGAVDRLVDSDPRPSDPTPA
jgi:fumarate reductase (CoM/CoB) subunit B